MKTLKQHLPVLALTLGLVLSGSNVMQGQSNGHRTTTQRQSNTTTQKREGRTISERNSTVKRGQTSGHRQSSNIQQVRPGGGNSSDRPGGNRPDNGNSQARPGGNSQGRPGGNRPGGNRPGGGNSMDRPGGNGNRPGGNRPGHGWNPGHGGPGNNYRPSNSVPPPGAGGYRPSYRPPRQYRWERPVPPPPPRYAYVRVGVPTIGDILGLAFGSLIDYGINSLINTGYQVVGTYNDVVYLNNVTQFGITWPEASMYYGPSGLRGARFQYGSYSPTDYRYRSAYSQLCAIYGQPVSVTNTGYVTTATWWGGNNTGYITLQYGPGVNQTGARMYYTDLIYGTL